MVPTSTCTNLGHLDTSAGHEERSQLRHAGTTSPRRQEGASEKILLSAHISGPQDSQ